MQEIMAVVKGLLEWGGKFIMAINNVLRKL